MIKVGKVKGDEECAFKSLLSYSQSKVYELKLGVLAREEELGALVDLIPRKGKLLLNILL
jgi:hypothetical protein